MRTEDPGTRRSLRCTRRPAGAGPAVLALALLLAAPGTLLAQGGEGAERGSVAAADTVLRFEPVRLPPLRVEVGRTARPGKMRGFDRRRRRHPAGVFVGRAEIERRDPRRTSDLLRGVAGVTPGRPPAGVGRPRVRMDRTPFRPGRRACRVRYFVDGVPMPGDGGFRVDDLAPGEVEAVEVYRGVSEVPPRFQRREDRCGTVVIWTRAPGGRR